MRTFTDEESGRIIQICTGEPTPGDENDPGADHGPVVILPRL